MTNVLSSLSPNSKSLSPKGPFQKKQNKLGPYNLLQTLGEGEFGKVKLGINTETGQEVAIKLIKKEGDGSSSRINKVEREISVLKTLNHPYIVKLFNVVETEKYIGIILEYASGGELFEYILAHRYLKEKDAKRFFAQLISSVQYMHKRKIVHRDLKLENLLLDKNRNIVVTDFGFANQFSSTADDLMATTCGSPCYAAPELVVNAGLYVGSAVDIWSCGVILYAMLCGFLPFDDDPTNPDSDNINQLYRYILSTHLMFPAYVSIDARDLLEKMLVPDPTKRCALDYIIKHPWLEAYRDFLKKDSAQMEMEVLATSRISSMPTSPKLEKSDLVLTNSVSTTVQSAKREVLLVSRKTHIPRDRFAPVATDKYLLTANKIKPYTTEKSSRSISPTFTVANKTNSFRHFSIGRSTTTTTPIEKPAIHATVSPTTPTPTDRVSKVPNFITRKPVKKEEEILIATADISNATAVANASSSADINPENSLSSPVLTQDSKMPTMSAFGSIRRNQHRGTDKFLSFFTGGRASHIPVANKNHESRPFTLQKEEEEEVYHNSHSGDVVSEAISSHYLDDDEILQQSNITGNMVDNEEEEQQEDKEKPRMVHSFSEDSTIGGSTPSLSMSPSDDSSNSTASPLSPVASIQEQTISSISKSVVSTNGLAEPTQIYVDTSSSTSATPDNQHLNVNVENIATSPTIVSDTIQEEDEVAGNAEEVANNNATSPSFRDEETSSNISRQQQQARDRGSSITAASILSDKGASVSINSSVVSFKDAPRRTPLLFGSQKGGSPSFIMRQKQQHQHCNQQCHRSSIDNGSSISSSTDQQHDNASVSSAGTAPQLEVSNSTRLTTKTVVTNSMGDGGRKAMAAVRRSIYRKHMSQPPPQRNNGQVLSDASSNSSSIQAAAQKEPLISFAKSRFEESGTQITQERSIQQSNNHRNTWSATSLITSVSELPGKKKIVATKPEEAVASNSRSTTTNNTALPQKRTGKKMMDFFKKKSHSKETKKETSNAAPPVTSNPSATTAKAHIPSNTQILTKSRKLNTKRETPAVAAATPKSSANVTTTTTTNSSKKIATTSSSANKNKNNVVSILQAPSTKSTGAVQLSSPTPSPTPPSPKKKIADVPLVIPPHSNNRRTARAVSGNEAALSTSLKKEANIDERIQIHQGAIDRTALTSQSPVEVMKDVTRILRILGIDAKPDGPFVVKCSRRKAKSYIAAELLKKKDDNEDDQEDLEAAAEHDNHEDDDQVVINDSAITTTSEVSLLARSSNKDSQSLSSVSSTNICSTSVANAQGLEPIYGDASIDNGDEIRFAVEICRFKNLPGLYIVNIRRLRGNAWAYKFLYHKLIDFLDLGKNGGYIQN